MYSASEKLINPEHSVAVCYPMEFPSQEGLLHPFWKAISENLTQEGVNCKLTVMLTDNFVRFPERYTQLYPFNANIHTTSHEILVKPRPENEMRLLQQWQEANPHYKLRVSPRFESKQDIIWYIDRIHVYDSNQKLLKNEDINIEINGQNICIFQLMRATNSRPPVAFFPKTSEEWKHLEDSLVPSTLRDEVQWIRMQLDYYCAKNSERSMKKNELVDWISSLPEPQQTVFVSSLGNQFYKRFMNDRTETETFGEMKNDLINSFFEKMTSEIQIQQYTDSDKLQHPWGKSMSSNSQWQPGTQRSGVTGVDGYKVEHA